MFRRVLTVCSSAVLIQGVLSYDISNQGRYLYQNGKAKNYSFIGGSSRAVQEKIYHENSSKVQQQDFSNWNENVFGTLVGDKTTLKNSFENVQKLFEIIQSQSNDISDCIAKIKEKELDAEQKNGLGIIERLLGREISCDSFYDMENISDINWYMTNWNIEYWYNEFIRDLPHKKIADKTEEEVGKSARENDVKEVCTKGYLLKDGLESPASSTGCEGQFSTYSVNDTSQTNCNDISNLCLSMQTSFLCNTMVNFVKSSEESSSSILAKKILARFEQLGLTNNFIDKLERLEDKLIYRYIALRVFISNRLGNFITEKCCNASFFYNDNNNNSELLIEFLKEEFKVSLHGKYSINKEFCDDITNFILYLSNFEFMNTDLFKDFYKNVSEYTLNSSLIALKEKYLSNSKQLTQQKAFTSEEQKEIAKILIQKTCNGSSINFLVSAHNHTRPPQKEESKHNHTTPPQKEESKNILKKFWGMFRPNNLTIKENDSSAKKDVGISATVLDLQDKESFKNTKAIYISSIGGEIGEKTKESVIDKKVNKAAQEREQEIKILKENAVKLVDEMLKYISYNESAIFCIAKNDKDNIEKNVSTINSTKENAVLETIKNSLLYAVAKGLENFLNEKVSTDSEEKSRISNFDECLRIRVENHIKDKISNCDRKFIIKISPEKIRGYLAELEKLAKAIEEYKEICKSSYQSTIANKDETVFNIVQDMLNCSDGIISAAIIYND